MSATALPDTKSQTRRRVPEQVIRLGIVVILILAIGILGCTVTNRFGTTRNILNIYEQSTDLALVSLGQTLAVLTGGIDLSVGSMISLLSVLTSGLINSNGDLVIPFAPASFCSVSSSASSTVSASSCCACIPSS